MARLGWMLLYVLLMLCYIPVILLSVCGWLLGTCIEETREALHEKAFGARR